MTLNLKIKSQPLDFELCKLLGDRPADFLVLCLDGVQLEDFGTPYDTPSERVRRNHLVELLNDRTEDSLWPKMWEQWKQSLCKQFNLPETTTDKEFHPVVSYEISRVCHGYSEHIHAAIGLFDKLADKIENWSVSYDGQCVVAITTKRGARITRVGVCMSLTIAQAVRDMLQQEVLAL